MPNSLVFVQGDSLRAIRNREERRKIRSDIIKASWRSKRRSEPPLVPSVAEKEWEHQERDLDNVIRPASERSVRNTSFDPSGRVLEDLHESPRSFLSAARSDPFSANGLEREDMFGQSVLDYCRNSSIGVCSKLLLTLITRCYGALACLSSGRNLRSRLCVFLVPSRR